MRRPRLTVHGRLLTVVSVSVVGFAILGALTLGLVNDVSVGGALYERFRAHTEIQRQLGILREHIEEIRADTVMALLVGDRDQARALSAHTGAVARTETGRFQAVLDRPLDDDVRAVFESARQTWDEFVEANAAIFARLLDGRKPTDDALRLQRLREQRFDEQLESASNLLALRDEALELEVTTAVTRRIHQLGIVGAGFSFLVVGLTLAITRSITVPLRRLARVCERVAAGDLEARTHLVRCDELGDVARAFDTMVTELARSQTSLREAEALYRSVFEHAQEGMFRSSPEGIFLMANPALARIYGFDSPDELLETMRDIGGQLYVDGERRAELVRRIERDGIVTGFESKVYTNDGRIIWITESAHGVRDETGRLFYFEGSVQDITERKQVDQMKSDFVSFATHQLRTPLSGIKWMLELASEAPGVPEDAASYIADGQEAADRLIRLVNDLLDAARLESGRLKSSPEATDLAALTQSVLGELEPLAGEKGHRVSVSAAAAMPPVMVDPQLFRQAVTNLVSNAIAAVPAAPARGRLGRRLHRPEGERRRPGDARAPAGGVREAVRDWSGASARTAGRASSRIPATVRSRPDFEHILAVLEREGVLGRGPDPLSGVSLFRGKGCVQCGFQGYRGRLGVFELFEVSDDIRRMIMERADAGSIRAAAVQGGMKTMFEDGLAKVFLGETTLEEVFRVAL